MTILTKEICLKMIEALESGSCNFLCHAFVEANAQDYKSYSIRWQNTPEIIELGVFGEKIGLLSLNWKSDVFSFSNYDQDYKARIELLEVFINHHWPSV